MVRKTYQFLFALLLLNSCKDVEVNKQLKQPEKKEATKPKQESTIVNPAFAVENIFGIWSQNNNDPHADFEITKSSFYLVDYDGNGEMRYEINDNKIKIYYPESELHGMITKAENDSLVIYWSDGQQTTYLRWTQ